MAGGREGLGDSRRREKEISPVTWINLTDGHSWIHECREADWRVSIRSRASSDPQIPLPDWPVGSVPRR